MSGLIGIMPFWDDEKKHIYMDQDCFASLHSVGLDSIIFPLTDDEAEIKRLTDLCDGFLLTGGDDVNPCMYGEAPTNDTVRTNPSRDHMESIVLNFALAADKPILAICRGFQLLNVVLGGTLYQDLPTQRPTKVTHSMKEPYNRRSHDDVILNGTPLHRLLDKDKIEVNSLHHQAIKKLAPSLVEMARSEDGLIESAYRPENTFVWGVQWHPEHWTDGNQDSVKIFQEFASRTTGT